MAGVAAAEALACVAALGTGVAPPLADVASRAFFLPEALFVGWAGVAGVAAAEALACFAALGAGVAPPLADVASRAFLLPEALFAVSAVLAAVGGSDGGRVGLTGVLVPEALAFLPTTVLRCGVVAGVSFFWPRPFVLWFLAVIAWVCACVVDG